MTSAPQVPRAGRASGPDHLLGIEHLVDCIQLGQKPVLSVEHALHVVDIIEQAGCSAETGRVMPIASRFEPTVLPRCPFSGAPSFE